MTLHRLESVCDQFRLLPCVLQSLELVTEIVPDQNVSDLHVRHAVDELFDHLVVGVLHVELLGVSM